MYFRFLSEFQACILVDFGAAYTTFPFLPMCENLDCCKRSYFSKEQPHVRVHAHT